MDAFLFLSLVNWGRYITVHGRNRAYKVFSGNPGYYRGGVYKDEIVGFNKDLIVCVYKTLKTIKK